MFKTQTIANSSAFIKGKADYWILFTLTLSSFNLGETRWHGLLCSTFKLRFHSRQLPGNHIVFLLVCQLSDIHYKVVKPNKYYLKLIVARSMFLLEGKKLQSGIKTDEFCSRFTIINISICFVPIEFIVLFLLPVNIVTMWIFLLD